MVGWSASGWLLAAALAAWTALDRWAAGPASPSPDGVGGGTSVASAAAAGRLPVQVASYPRIYVADSLFSPAECDELVRAAVVKGVKPVSTMGSDGRIKGQNAESRRSLSAEFGPDDPVTKPWRERMANLALLPVSHGEPQAVTCYVGGADHKYELHFDSSLQVGRVATVLVFLSDVFSGGELMFPWARTTPNGSWPEGVFGRGRPIEELVGVTREPRIAPMCEDGGDRALKIAPRKGRAVVFFTHAPDLKRYGYRAMHAGCSPRAPDEDKWITQLFLRWHDWGSEPNGLLEAMRRLEDAWRRPLHE